MFYDCESLKHIKLPDRLEKIGPKCFERSGLEEITVPASVKEIGGEAFC